MTQILSRYFKIIHVSLKQIQHKIEYLQAGKISYNFFNLYNFKSSREWAKMNFNVQHIEFNEKLH